DQRPLKRIAGLGSHRLEPRFRRRNPRGRIFGLRPRALEDEEVVGGEVDGVEPQRGAAVRQPPIEIGAAPVGDRHEIVAEHLHAGPGGVADRLLVIVDFLPEGARTRLDLLADADAFDHRPDEAGPLDLRPALEDLVLAPRLAPVHVMERGDDAHRPSLGDVVEADWVVRPEPAPGLQHEEPPYDSPRPLAGEGSGVRAASPHPALRATFSRAAGEGKPTPSAPSPKTFPPAPRAAARDSGCAGTSRPR